MSIVFFKGGYYCVAVFTDHFSGLFVIMGATIGTRLYTFFNGKAVGRDAFGNSYYIEKSPAKGVRARRWVIYNGMAEPSKVPPLWHAWLHYTTDTLPTEIQRKPYFWEKPHLPNLTGTRGAYFPPGHKRGGGRRAAAASDYEAWEPEA